MLFIQRNSIRCILTFNILASDRRILSERKLKRSWDFCFNWPNVEILGISDVIFTQCNIMLLCLGDCLLVYVILAVSTMPFYMVLTSNIKKNCWTGSWLQSSRHASIADAMFLTLICCIWVFHHFLIYKNFVQLLAAEYGKMFWIDSSLQLQAGLEQLPENKQDWCWCRGVWALNLYHLCLRLLSLKTKASTRTLIPHNVVLYHDYIDIYIKYITVTIQQVFKNWVSKPGLTSWADCNHEYHSTLKNYFT